MRRAKEESLRGQFDQMRMREDENIAKYVERVKASVSLIKAFGGDIKEEIIISSLNTTSHLCNQSFYNSRKKM